MMAKKDVSEGQFDLFGLAAEPIPEPKKSNKEKVVVDPVEAANSPITPEGPEVHQTPLDEIDIFAELESFLTSDFINEVTQPPTVAPEVVAEPAIEVLLPTTVVSAAPKSDRSFQEADSSEGVLITDAIPEPVITTDAAQDDVESANASTPEDNVGESGINQPEVDPREVMDIVEFSIGEPPVMAGYQGKYKGMWLTLATQGPHFARMSADEKIAMQGRLKGSLIEGTNARSLSKAQG